MPSSGSCVAYEILNSLRIPATTPKVLLQLTRTYREGVNGGEGGWGVGMSVVSEHFTTLSVVSYIFRPLSLVG